MITERAMLAAVHISIWTAVKHDRKVSRDVADQHGAFQGAGRYNKQLLRGADKLDELRYRSGQSHPFPGGLKVIDWRHEPVSDFFSYRSAAAQFC